MNLAVPELFFSNPIRIRIEQQRLNLSQNARLKLKPSSKLNLPRSSSSRYLSKGSTRNTLQLLSRCSIKVDLIQHIEEFRP